MFFKEFIYRVSHQGAKNGKKRGQANFWHPGKQAGPEELRKGGKLK
jgi:hypothetical protein